MATPKLRLYTDVLVIPPYCTVSVTGHTPGFSVCPQHPNLYFKRTGQASSGPWLPRTSPIVSSSSIIPGQLYVLSEPWMICRVQWDCPSWSSVIFLVPYSSTWFSFPSFAKYLKKDIEEVRTGLSLVNNMERNGFLGILLLFKNYWCCVRMKIVSERGLYLVTRQPLY